MGGGTFQLINKRGMVGPFDVVHVPGERKKVQNKEESVCKTSNVFQK